MARTEAGRQVTEQHRQRQLALRASALREFQNLWPAWQVNNPSSFDALVEASVPLVRQANRGSAAIGARYFETFRDAEGVTGSARVVRTPEPPREMISNSLRATGIAQARRSINAGFSVQAARQTALTTLSGAVTRLALDGGRGTVLASTLDDGQSISWVRVTGGNPCAFCAMLASRGPAYTSHSAATQVTGRMGKWDRYRESDSSRRPVSPRGNRQIGESYHDHCACTVEPHYEGSQPTPDAERFGQLWDEHARGLPPDEARRAFRRALES